VAEPGVQQNDSPAAATFSLPLASPLAIGLDEASPDALRTTRSRPSVRAGSSSCSWDCYEAHLEGACSGLPCRRRARGGPLALVQRRHSGHLRGDRALTANARHRQSYPGPFSLRGAGQAPDQAHFLSSALVYRIWARPEPKRQAGCAPSCRGIGCPVAPYPAASFADDPPVRARARPGEVVPLGHGRPDASLAGQLRLAGPEPGRQPRRSRQGPCPGPPFLPVRPHH
jgi:hypothetical protein